MITLPIVGAFYRPPAKAILGLLPLGAPLRLKAEPDNPADPNAVAVYATPETLDSIKDQETADDALAGYGTSLGALQDGGEDIHLGYIPAVAAAELHASGRVDSNFRASGEFALSAKGAPLVNILNL